jgi:hypothetical protein
LCYNKKLPTVNNHRLGKFWGKFLGEFLGEFSGELFTRSGHPDRGGDAADAADAAMT